MALNVKSELVHGVRGRRYRDGGRLHRNVRIYLDADDSHELDVIELVKYELHPTFRERIRVSEDRTRQFEVKIWTWGHFEIKVKLFMKDGSMKLIDGYVKW